MARGKVIDFREREFIVRLKEYFDQERIQGLTVSTKDAIGRVAAAVNVGRRSVEQVLASFHRNGHLGNPDLCSRGKPPYSLCQPLETTIREHIRQQNREGKHISLETLSHWLEAELQQRIPKATLGRTLQRMGFVYGISKTRSRLRERDEVIVARREYLRKKLANRNPAGGTYRPEIYLDESYVNVNHSSPVTWYFDEDGPFIEKPSGKGRRLIIVNAISEEGWVDDVKLVFEAKKRTGDYHGQMNYDNFSRWFEQKLLPNIPQSSLIVMDNAPYHNVYDDDTFYPVSATRKDELVAWLKEHHPSEYDSTLLKPELFKRCRAFCPVPAFKLDVIAAETGHTILRTPPYHPELQPIEECWGVVKNYCAQRCEYTMEKLREHLEEGFAKVTEMICQGVIKHSKQEEDKYWAEDTIDDDDLEDLHMGSDHLGCQLAINACQL